MSNSPLDLSFIQYARTFSTVAETESIRRAAEMLHLTPSAVSYQITRLEEQLGVALFDRLPGQGLRLLPQGQQLQVLLPPLFGAVSHLQTEITKISQRQEHIRMGGIPGLTHLLIKAFSLSYPNGSGPLFSLETGTGEELCQKLLSSELDFACFFLEYLHPALTFETLFSSPLDLLVPENMAEQVDPENPGLAIAKLPVIINLGGSYLKSLDACNMMEVKPHVRMYVHSASLALDAVALGLGIAIVARHALPDNLTGMRAFPLGNAVMPRCVVLASVKDRLFSQEHRRFKEIMTAYFKQTHQEQDKSI